MSPENRSSFGVVSSLLLLADFLFPLFFICFFFWLYFPLTMNTFSLFILLCPFYPLLPIFTFSYFFLSSPSFSPSSIFHCFFYFSQSLLSFFSYSAISFSFIFSLFLIFRFLVPFFFGKNDNAKDEKVYFRFFFLSFLPKLYLPS